MKNRNSINMEFYLFSRFDDSQVNEMMQVFNKGNDEPIRALLKIVLNNMMIIERHNNASSHERTEERNDYSNGFKANGGFQDRC